jgi:hypothetical protein
MNEIVKYTAEGLENFQVLVDEDTVWLTIGQMCVLFDKSRATINEHILNVFKENELEKEEVMRKIGNPDLSLSTTKPTNYYNLDVIMSGNAGAFTGNETKFGVSNRGITPTNRKPGYSNE